MEKKENIYYVPEWYPQDAVLLAWPYELTDWRHNINEVVKTYQELIAVISGYQKVVLICPKQKSVEKQLSKANLRNIIFIELDYNDTWTRDYGPITVYKNNRPQLLDFMFNGWGGKFNSELDNQATKNLFNSGIFNNNVEYNDCHHFILEGGSIDTDGKGTLLTTEKCVLSDTRNGKITKQHIEKELINKLGIAKVIWLKEGYLNGDDTDGHIDTLAKFCNDCTIAFSSCIDKNDEQYNGLYTMKKELSEIRSLRHEKYQLVDLPIPSPVYNSYNQRLPATYANFLITNEAVLVPAYRDKNDDLIKEKLTYIFKDKDVILIDCLSLIQQNGSLHCITMQLPKGTLQ